MVKKDRYTYSVDGGLVRLFRDGKLFLTLPAAASVNGVTAEPSLLRSDAHSAEFSFGAGKMSFTFYEDSIIVSCEVHFSEDTPIYETKLFRTADAAIALSGFDRAFTPQPRNNAGRNVDYFEHLPDISLNGYFTPPTLQFSIGSLDGWVSFGLLDIPDSFFCKMDDDHSFLVESCGGNKVIKKGEAYRIPRVLITFPEDEFRAVSLFRQKLIELGEYAPQRPKRSQLPAWWSAPLVCTYGDQMLEKRVGAGIDEAWVYEFADIAEKEWGLSEFNLVIDDAWQLPFSFEPAVDKARFPDLRKLIDTLHERGCHVILWCTPMFDNAGIGSPTRTQRLGVLSDYRFADYDPNGYIVLRAPECHSIDYTADNARQFLREFCEEMFGDGEGQLNADGVKLDFMANLRNPAQTQTYSHPERGIGMTELRLFFEMFGDEAKRVKPDVLIDCTVGDPRFEQYLSLNRLHDTHSGTREKEIRAALAALACPELPIDSDGALMYTSWVKKHYTAAAIYSVPALYYVKKFQDWDPARGWEALYPGKPAVEFTAEEKLQLGRLLELSRLRPDGAPVMDRFGNWSLVDGDTVTALSTDGETVVFYPTDDAPGYLFTWQDEAFFLPLSGRKFSSLEPAESCLRCQPDYARDRVLLQLKPGIVYTFRDEDDGRSIDRAFSERRNTATEEQVNYEN